MEKPTDVSSLFSEGGAVWVRGSSAVSFPCVWAVPACVCLSVWLQSLSAQSELAGQFQMKRSLWDRPTHSHALAHTVHASSTMLHTYRHTHTSPELPGGCSLLVVQQEKPDEASPHQLHCPLPAFLSHSFPTFHLAVSGISGFYSFFSLCHILCLMSYADRLFLAFCSSFFFLVSLLILPILPLHIPSILKLIKPLI